ncbi:MAG: polyprenol monophosphomannose synthase [Candidatus Omnitrophica bacterium]|nr:polyprenol monophosphomannose synthase [Candidatus Omnitrophota bacterium]
MKPILIIPTYNERENIADIHQAIRREHPQDVDILVVDSASPDKTADRVRELQRQDPRLFIYEQTSKLGLGRAYLEAMQWVLKKNQHDLVITMDADFSHHPRYIKTLLHHAQDYDLVIGSRYIHGGRLENWPFRRLLMSRFANGYARMITGLPFYDLTSGFHCFRMDLLRRILKHPIHTEGYAFLIELKSLAILEDASFYEIPICFSDRTKGSSKISKKVIWESVCFVMRQLLQRSEIRRAYRRKKTAF